MSGRVVHGSQITSDVILRPDVAVIGSGPGGAMAASKLAAAGLEVVILEEGGWYESNELGGGEAVSYRNLFQDSASRATDDLGIIILQGRTAGGGSTVNWMTSLRVPPPTLEHWSKRKELRGLDEATLAPHFAAIERRLNVHTAAPGDVNAANRVLREGATWLGLDPVFLPRNTRECTNIGLCTMGCPIDAKMSAQMTYLQDALADGAAVYADVRVTRMEQSRRAIVRVQGDVLDRETRVPNGRKVIVEPRTVFLAAGALNSPALLLRSGISSDATGRRTWLHPVTATAALFDERMDPWYGSPQSIAVENFRDRGSRMGYLVEVPPLYPILGALAAPWFGAQHASLMGQLPHVASLLALIIDGFGDDEEGGTVTVGRSGQMKFRYPFTDLLREAAAESMKSLARIQLAAGARKVMTLHNRPVEITTDADVALIDAAPFGPGQLSLFTAHQMGGCAMGENRRTSVVDSTGRHHEIHNLFVSDGSLFPTSLGVNPMLTIYATASHVTDRFLERR